MPKRQSPYKERPFKAKIDSDRFMIKIGRSKFYFPIEAFAFDMSVLANEAYAHGYRNGMRAGRKG